MSLEHLAVPESKEMIKNQPKETPTLMGLSTGHRNQLKELPVAKAGAI